MERAEPCDSVGSLTRCVDSFMDLSFPECSTDAFQAGNCSSDDFLLRTTVLTQYRRMNYRELENATGCLKTCVARNEIYEYV